MKKILLFLLLSMLSVSHRLHAERHYVENNDLVSVSWEDFSHYSADGKEYVCTSIIVESHIKDISMLVLDKFNTRPNASYGWDWTAFKFVYYRDSPFDEYYPDEQYSFPFINMMCVNIPAKTAMYFYVLHSADYKTENFIKQFCKFKVFNFDVTKYKSHKLYYKSNRIILDYR